VAAGRPQGAGRGPRRRLSGLVIDATTCHRTAMHAQMKSLTITPPSRPLTGRVTAPGSKSITNRALLLAALAQGTSRLTGALKSKDTALMAAALRQMGVSVEEPDATSFVVTSDGTLKAPTEPLVLGNAGTATRFLTAAV